jgi:ABC-type transport system involved in cytochrome c biogenesis permease component
MSGTLGTLLRRELAEVALQPRTWVVAALLSSLMVAAAASHGPSLRQAQQGTAHLEAEHRKVLEGKTVGESVGLLHPAVRPPWHLGFLTGEVDLLPEVHRQSLSALVDPRRERLPSRSRIPALDWLFLFQTVLPLAACALAYDAVCGDRRRGTLRLVLANPVPRHQVLAAKLLARWCCLALPLLVGFLVGTPLAEATAGRPWAEDLPTAVGGMLPAIGPAAFLYLAVALLVSTLSRRSTGALVVLALLWVGATQVIPTIGVVTARRWQPVPSPQEVEARLAAVLEQVEAESGDAGGWRRPAVARQDDFAWERRAAEIQNRRYRRQEEVRRGALLERLAQREAARTLALLSPTVVLEQAVLHLVGAGPPRDRAFVAQTAAYREELAAYHRALDEADPQSPHLHFFPDYLSTRPLVPEHFPRFTFQELSRESRLRRAAPYLALLMLETLLVVGLALWAFGRSDVR